MILLLSFKIISRGAIRDLIDELNSWPMAAVSLLYEVRTVLM
jgi:hypothetical protein